MDRITHRLALAALIGIPLGLLVPLGGDVDRLVRPLACYVFTGLAFVAPLARTILTEDPARTRERMSGGDGERDLSDVLVVAVGLISLLAVAVLLVGGRTSGDAKAMSAAVGLATVAVGWCCVHAIYTMRYARIYYASDEPPIDFNDDEDPALSDFAYFSFNLGMTYQVSDTDVKTRDLRKVILAHTLLSYLYGTVVIATTVNLVAGFTN
ncbi:DUF1345 domain-containing protein [Knoellia subterranea]|uniref:DUF1345 domain-containing protein n=1 Tax=Knoellia subterranea KCTC 19937 TaxID=1385521 RepID=A0A0A0JKY4_9MICO|nr:DUF1345 domain-containing protein [Knoellia subterranea]KGN37778.1 hypothetical protein N803_12020 [Knoellia subterranea KCTC 19937]